ncbi:ArnT family glycosyltransferase [Fluviicola taffensis]|uniref:Glycosyltransferase RgtA/B/C/D-like domain-containing protein n=1 Tax=Fluviicola taffensis (strain DSM 16823 / NCIMB 13979 / RW262) TaxID=755732 RepID=F2ICW2_FLUTR|nr:hypothetical protein [Fluviicola taffensis]AEA43336.1 hypothetical protein Fluta_1341 [Fluviicola taffensis DSM 16823]
MNQTNTSSKIATWAFFLALLIYAILRAWFVEPIHDEVATYFHYIETGEIKGGRSLMDANNHLLNSWLGNFSYRLFGEHFFLFRFPSILCFCLYFWSSRKLTSNLNLGLWGELCFVALNTIPWIFDYFSYTRGYGLGIGFFMAGLFQLSMWLKEKHTGHLILVLFFFYLAVLSNLTYLITSLMVIGYIAFMTLLHAKKIGVKALVFHGFLLLVFCFSILPLIEFSFALKEAGALYYGSLDGLWWVTGKTLSKYILFYDANWLRIAYCLIGLIGAIILFIQWKKESWVQFLSSTSFWVSMLIGGNILAILILAKIMKVNYPEDRAAMYLVPLSILALTTLFAQSKISKYFLVVLVLFPVSFLVKLNLNTSIFSPDDRMSEEFYTTAMKDLKPNQTVSIYPIMQLTYSLFERTNPNHVEKHIGTVQKDFLPSSDLILTKTTYLFSKDDISMYDVVAEDPASTYIALRRKKPFQQVQLFDSIGKTRESDDEYISFYGGPIRPEWRNKQIQINLKGHLKTDKELNDFNMVVATNDSTEQNLRYDYQNIRWYVGENVQQFKLNYPYAARNFKNEESQLIIYIWNPERKHFKLTNPSIEIIELK